MPTIPLYNQGSTEEAGLTRAKKRVISLMYQGLSSLTDKPAYDMSNGKADEYANVLITQMEEITSYLSQLYIFFEEQDYDIYIRNYDDAKKVIKLIVLAIKFGNRAGRTAAALLPGFEYMDLGVLADIKAAKDELEQYYHEVFTLLTASKILVEVDDLDSIASEIEDEISIEFDENPNVEELSSIESDMSSLPSRVNLPSGLNRTIDSMFNRQMITQNAIEDAPTTIPSSSSSSSRSMGSTERVFGDETQYQRLVLKLQEVCEFIFDTLETGFDNFNEVRQQIVYPAQVKTAPLTGSGFNNPLYSIGNQRFSGLHRYI
jgi:hypothetical protein